jgi:hypothetical protein
MAIGSFRIARLFPILIIAVVLSGCAHHKAKEEKPAGTYLEDIYATSNPSTDLEKFSSAMPPYLGYIDGLIHPETEDGAVFSRVSGAYYGYAFCFVEDKDKKEGQPPVPQGKRSRPGRAQAVPDLRPGLHL